MICSRAFLCGVDRYPWLSHEAQLWASASITRLQDLMRWGDVPTSTTLVVETGKNTTTRIEVLDRLTAFASSLDRDESALVYFACHGFQTEQGLVLAASDFRPTIPFDSGISLQRVQEILAGGTHQGGHVLVVLDCCRLPHEVFRKDVVLPGISIIYAARTGGIAIETKCSSVMVECMREALVEVPRVLIGRKRYCRLTDLLATMRAIRPKVFAGENLSLDAHGEIQEDFLLPIPSQTKRRRNSRSFSVTLSTKSLSTRLFQASQRTLQAKLSHLGLDPEKHLSAQSSGSNGDGLHVLRCNVATGNGLLRPALVVQALLYSCPSLFEKAIVCLPLKVGFPLLQKMAKLFRGELGRQDDTTVCVTWVESSACVRAEFVEKGDQTMCILKCTSREGRFVLPLENSEKIYAFLDSILMLP